MVCECSALPPRDWLLETPSAFLMALVALELFLHVCVGGILGGVEGEG